ncbi:MAG TPA: serine hydrolase domain-containing protein [Cyclobacteriaceae bacterium]|jgi:D-alanyl-D-alanine carboxypeptidase|nr:serine hydrolase domain-containing protein [Cyclobacteriaceae bacterium]
MKEVLYWLLLFSLFATCSKEDWSIPETTCTLDFSDSSQNNPKGSDYKKLIDGVVSRGVPGMVLLVRTPKEGLWIGAAGMSKIETSDPMLPCTIHHSASVAKMYMGTAIMLLVEDGKVDLDAPIKNYLDADLCNHIGNGNTATVRQLMNHSSGIRDFVEETNHITDYFNNFFNNYTTSDFLHYIYDKPANFAAGTSVEYSNTNFVLITLIIDNVTGKPHPDFLTERIFKKLQLNQTFYKNEPGYPDPPGLTNSYWDRYGNGQLENITQVAIHFDELSVGHDAMLASTHDFAKFIDALVKGRIVSNASLKQMMEWKYDQSKKAYNGLALIMEKTKYGNAIGHGGGNFGVAMEVRYYPERDATVVFCSNISGFFPSPALNVLTGGFTEAVENIAFK